MPRYETRREIGRAVAISICLPSFLSAFFILIGEASREKSWTGLGVALFWPVIAYTAATHAWRVLLWRSCNAKYSSEYNVAKEYWKQSYQIELLFLLFVYFSAYLTGINALLDVGWPAADGNADALLSFNNLTNATTTEQHQTEDSSVGVKVVCGICLVVYALVPPAFCAYYGKQVISNRAVELFGKDIVPDISDVPEGEKPYEEFLAQKGGEEPFLSIVAPFEKRFAWYKAIVLIDAAVYACCVALPRDDLAKLILATVFSILFAVGSIVTQPYRDVVEDRTDMASRAFVILTLVVGIILETEPGPGGRTFCDGILGMVVLASSGMFIYVLNPLRLLRGIRKAMRDSRNAAKSAGWNEQAIKDLDAEELKEIDVSVLSKPQTFWLLKHHSLAFPHVTKLDLSNAGLDGECREFPGSNVSLQ